MSLVRWPIDGVYGKSFKTTSSFGWRIHPIQKTKKHHNGEDLWAAPKEVPIKAFADGKVIKAKKSGAAGGGFGWFVQIQHKIDGEYYTSCYAHMVEGSLAVKVGQKVTAGAVLGLMGSTGASTGKHLHFEIWKGKTHGWTADGSGFVDPVMFVEGLIKKQTAIANAPLPTPEDAPVAPAPVHGPKPAAPAKPKTYTVKRGDTLTKIAKANKTTVKALQELNKIKNANLIKVGQVIKLG